MSQYKKGAAALGKLKSDNGGGGGSDYEFTPFKSGTTLTVKVQGAEDLMQYFGYGIFKKVNTFVAKNPSVRNDRGYVEDNFTPWDRAAEYYYGQAREAEESGASDDEVKSIRRTAYQFAGKERYAMGFHNLTTGEDIVVDFTRDQARGVYAVIEKYAKRLDRLAFELSKTGARQDTEVSLMPVIDMDEDLTEEERKHFEAAKGKPFNSEMFNGLLYEMDEKEQIESLVAAGFDISLIGETVGGAESEEDEVTPVNDEDAPVEIDDEDLPF